MDKCYKFMLDNHKIKIIYNKNSNIIIIYYYYNNNKNSKKILFNYYVQDFIPLYNNNYINLFTLRQGKRLLNKINELMK